MFHEKNDIVRRRMPASPGAPLTNMVLSLIQAEISNYIYYNLSIPKLQQLHCWSLEMEKQFHPTLY